MANFALSESIRLAMARLIVPSVVTPKIPPAFVAAMTDALNRQDKTIEAASKHLAPIFARLADLVRQNRE